MISDLTELAADARAVAEEYLATVVAGVDPELKNAVLAELTSFLCEHLTTGSTPAQVRTLAASAGTPDAESQASRLSRLWQQVASGFDPRGVAARVATTWWNPADERLLVPRAIGWGFDLNFGAIAVRLGLIEPDAEAEPFTSTPDSAFAKAAAVPAALAAATMLHYTVRGRRLPDRLPAHWDVAGTPDRWVGKRRAAVTDLTTTVVPAALAVLAARSDRSGVRRAGTLAATSAVAAGGAAVTILRSMGDRPRAWTGPATALTIAGAAGAVLFGLARAGRAAEIQADLGRGRP